MSMFIVDLADVMSLFVMSVVDGGGSLLKFQKHHNIRANSSI
jgi:hypothetical protein